MKNQVTKISLFILISLLIVSCNVTKKVPTGKRLLVKNQINVNNIETNQEEIYAQLYQKTNSSIFGYRLRLQLYNLAKKNSDTSYTKWLGKNPNRRKKLAKLLSEKQVDRLGKSFLVSGLSNFLMKTGEAPVLFDSLSAKKSLKRLESYFYNKGYFDVKASYSIDTSTTKKIGLNYKVDLKKPYVIDSLTSYIETPALDSLYHSKKNYSVIKSNSQYTTEDFNNERNRITTLFRNNGAYLFQQNYITYKLDTLDTNKKINVKLQIKNYSFRENDSSKTAPFKLYKIGKVAIYTDHKTTKKVIKVNDSLEYHDFILYSENKLKYRPKAITDAVFISKGNFYSDVSNELTTRYLSNLKVFNYPTIQYKVDPKDENALIANIFLTPRKKYTFGASVDFTHSNIQDFGISGNTSMGIRNVFNGAETFEIGIRGNIGASRDNANPNNSFFNISEIGIDAKLNFPRIFFPFKTEKIIAKSMIPSTSISVGFAKQKNIGLDKQNFTSAFTYNWTPSKNTAFRFDVLNIQFVKNLNIQNYFNIYQSSYIVLNDIANIYPGNPDYYDSDFNLLFGSGTDGYINEVLNGGLSSALSSEDLKIVRSIDERKKRLTENNLIFATSLSYSKTTSKGINDDSFYSYKTKIESAGNLLSLLARTSKQLENQSGSNTFFEVEYSQYLKGEFEFIKHWNFGNKKVIAMRSFAGLAVPYGNSKSVPFSRSYFSGGSNDNRAWQPYSLGPGSSGAINDFNEANLKLAFNAELRYNLFGKFNSALFTDIGNIWNVFDNVTEEANKFKGLESLKELAIGTGVGLRYDQGLFVVRFDLGFKTYNPSKIENERWFREWNFSKSVLNIGINYPF